MRPQLTVTAVAVAIWSASSALNVAYIPWGADGASSAFASAAAIWLISTLSLAIEFRRCDVEARGCMIALVATVGLLILAETLFWLKIDDDNNKPMLLRLSAGIDVGLVAAGLAVILALWPSRRLRRSQWPFALSARRAAKLVGGALALELALFAFRTVFRRSLVYYAMDCAMFAVAVLSVAIIIAALGRCVPVGRRHAEGA
jgi:hypothetical protein